MVVQAVRETPLVHHGLQIGLGVAVGVTILADAEETGDPAFARAVMALRRARRTRQPLVAIDPSGETRDEIDPLDAQMDDVGALPPGSTLGGMYRVLHEISRGAMGVVYRGEDLGLGRPIAIKVLRSDLAQDADLVAKFRDEAAMLASLHHPNLVQVYAFGTQGDDVYFVMELVEGEPASEMLRQARTHSDGLELALTAKMAVEVAGALNAMHNLGLIHRDVKPSNILVDRIRERAVLVDVGVAKRHDEAPDAAGTPGFAAPESFMDADESAATDVYGLASTVYLLLTGLAPFGSGEVEKVVQRQLYDTPAEPSSLRADVPPAVDAVLLRALQPNQKHRYATASEFAEALAEAVEDVAGESTRPERLIAAAEAALQVDRTTSRPPVRMPLTTRRSAITLDPPKSSGLTRGAMFRVAYRILGNRLGADWLSQLSASNPSLGEVLNPSLSPMSWQPIDHLTTLLTASMTASQDPEAFAVAIGRATMTATFARFFGADPGNLPTGKVIRAAERFWSRYHTWGRIVVENPEPQLCAVLLHDSPGEPVLCAMVEGSLQRIAELTGADDVSTRHSECVSAGAEACKFLVNWREPTVTPSDMSRPRRPTTPVR
jgi:serine/threonine-protein kinase